MSTRNYVEEFEYTDAKGLDTTSPVSMLTAGFTREAKNTNLGTTGGYTKRNGFTKQLATPWVGSVSIRQALEFKTSQGLIQNVFFGTDDVGVGKLGIEDGASPGSVIDILSPVSTTGKERMAFIQYDDRIFFLNGDNTNTPGVFNGKTSAPFTRDLGLAAPTATLTAVDGGPASSGLTAGSYVISYTFIIQDSQTGRIIAESSQSPPTTFVLDTAGNEIDLSVIQTSGATALLNEELKRRIYRTVPGGNILFFDQDIADNVTTTAVLSQSDAALDFREAPIDYSRLSDFSGTGYDKARFPMIARNRLFVASGTINQVRFSVVSGDGGLPESFPAINFVDVEGVQGQADSLVGLGKSRDIPIILKERSIGRLDEVGLPEIGRNEDPVTYLYREISSTVGAVSHFAQAEVFGELIFLGRDNVYGTDGRNVRPIANNIQATIRSFNFKSADRKPRLSMINDTKNRRVYISNFEELTAAQPNLILVGDYQQYPTFRWTFYTQGSDSTTHPGIRPGSFFQKENVSDGSLETYFGNTDGNGQYYKLNDGTSDLDSADVERGIFFRIVTRPYAMGEPLVIKLFKALRIFVEAADDTYSFRFCSIYDLGPDEELCDTFTIPALGDKWDEENWSNGEDMIWSGPALAEITYRAHRKAKFVQFVIEQTDKAAPGTFLGWGASGSIFGGL